VAGGWGRTGEGERIFSSELKDSVPSFFFFARRGALGGEAKGKNFERENPSLFFLPLT
jgi:hypothetical protein